MSLKRGAGRGGEKIEKGKKGVFRRCERVCFFDGIGDDFTSKNAKFAMCYSVKTNQALFLQK